MCMTDFELISKKSMTGYKVMCRRTCNTDRGWKGDLQYKYASVGKAVQMGIELEAAPPSLIHEAVPPDYGWRFHFYSTERTARRMASQDGGLPWKDVVVKVKARQVTARGSDNTTSLGGFRAAGFKTRPVVYVSRYITILEVLK